MLLIIVDLLSIMSCFDQTSVAKKEQTAYQEIAKLENLIEDLKSEKMSSERENSKMLAKIRQMDL